MRDVISAVQWSCDLGDVLPVEPFISNSILVNRVSNGPSDPRISGHVYVFVGYSRISCCTADTVLPTDLYKVPDAVPPIHAESYHVATDKDPSIDGGKFRSILGTIYNQSQLAERKHVARYCLINTVATSVPLVITTKLAAAILVVAVVRRVRRRGSAGPVLPVCIGDGFWCVICLFEPERIGLKGKE